MSTICNVFNDGRETTDEFVCNDVCVGSVCLYTSYSTNCIGICLVKRHIQLAHGRENGCLAPIWWTNKK